MATIIGFTSVAAVIVLIVMLIAWGNTASILARNYLVTASLSNVGELKSGAPVKIGGFQIGRVAAIRMRPGRTDLEVVMDISEEHAIPRKSMVRVSTVGLVGDSFLEIVPGNSPESLRKGVAPAEAESLESAEAPDLAQIMNRVDKFGEQLTIFTANLNDIIGEDEFRASVKRLASNMESVSYQANILIQRGQTIVDHVELATRNIAVLSGKLKEDFSRLTEDVSRSVARTAALAEAAAAKADAAVTNLDGGITDIRQAVGRTIGNPGLADDLAGGMSDIRSIAGALAKKSGRVEVIIDNLEAVSSSLKETSAKAGEVVGAVDATAVSDAVNRIAGAVASFSEVVEKIKAEPVLALSVNKAADRIVKTKFDEMNRNPDLRSADAMLDEINRWFRKGMERGRLADPAYEADERPYRLEPR